MILWSHLDEGIKGMFALGSFLPLCIVCRVDGILSMLSRCDFYAWYFIVRSSIGKCIASIVLLLIVEKVFREMCGLGGVC